MERTSDARFGWVDGECAEFQCECGDSGIIHNYDFIKCKCGREYKFKVVLVERIEGDLPCEHQWRVESHHARPGSNSHYVVAYCLRCGVEANPLAINDYIRELESKLKKLESNIKDLEGWTS